MSSKAAAGKARRISRRRGRVQRRWRSTRLGIMGYSFEPAFNLAAKASSGSLAESGEDKIYVNSGAGKHVHQDINAEEVDPPANDVADSRLCDTEQLGRVYLGEVTVFDNLAHGD